MEQNEYLRHTGLDVVLKGEAMEGRSAVDVSVLGRGYDVLSTCNETGTKYIIVKTTDKPEPVSLTRNELRFARKAGNDCYLYIVRCYDYLNIVIIQNPARAFNSEEKDGLTRYLVLD